MQSELDRNISKELNKGEWPEPGNIILPLFIQMIAQSDLLLLLSDANCGLSSVFSHSRAGCRFSQNVSSGLRLEGGAGPYQQGNAAVLGGTQEEQYDLNVHHSCLQSRYFSQLKTLNLQCRTFVCPVCRRHTLFCCSQSGFVNSDILRNTFVVVINQHCVISSDKSCTLALNTDCTSY